MNIKMKQSLKTQRIREKNRAKGKKRFKKRQAMFTHVHKTRKTACNPGRQTGLDFTYGNLL